MAGSTRPPGSGSTKNRKRSGSLISDDGRITLTFKRAVLHVPDVIVSPAGVPTGSAALELELDAEPQKAAPAAGPQADVGDGWGALRPSAPPSGRRGTLPPPKRPSKEVSLDPRRLLGDALSLVDRAPVGASADAPRHRDLEDEMYERFALGDFSGALTTAELILGRDPQHAPARDYAERCRQTLEQLYVARIGDLRGTPRRLVPDVELRWLGLDHRAGFLLSMIDGLTIVEDLLDLSGMPRLDAIRILAGLIEAGVVEVR